MTRYLWYWLLYPMLIPHTLLGLILAIPYRAHSWRWSDGCIEVIAEKMVGRPWAQTHGFVIFYVDDKVRDMAQLRVHERVHVVQGFAGPLFMLAYSVAFLYGLCRPCPEFRGLPRWYAAYRSIPFERQAYRIQDEYSAGKRPDAWGSAPP